MAEQTKKSAKASVSSKAKSNSKLKTSTHPKANNSTNQPDENSLKAVAAIGYLGILFLVPMLVYPKNKFAMFHANQGLLLLIAAIVTQIAAWILVVISFGLLFFIPILVWIGLLVLFVLGLVNAINGRMQRLPLIGNFDILKVQE